MIFLLVRALLDLQTTREEEERVEYIYLPLKTRKGYTTLRTSERERNRRFLGKKVSDLTRVCRGKGCRMGFFWGNNIPRLPKQREGNHSPKRTKNDRMRKKKNERKRESERWVNYECEKSALLANFFILMCLCGVLAKYAVFCGNARGITLAHYIYMYRWTNSLFLSFFLSLFLNESALISSFFVFQQNLVTIDQHLRV